MLRFAPGFRAPARALRRGLRVTGVAIEPPDTAADCPRATPELLAATLARASRSTDGVRVILARVDRAHPDIAIDSIFRFVDYGHASIGGLTGGIAIEAAGVSMLAAYRLFNRCQQSDGQENSSRYIRLDASALPHPEGGDFGPLPEPADVGIPTAFARRWRAVMEGAFAAYAAERARLEAQVAARPELAGTPAGASPLVAARFAKNFALDRTRYFLPFATRTTVSLVQTARCWAETIRHLASSPLPEEQRLAELYRAELAKFAPRLIKHSTRCPWEAHLQEREVATARALLHRSRGHRLAADQVDVRVAFGGLPWAQAPDSATKSAAAFRADLAGRPSRYGAAGLNVRSHVVEVRWAGMAVAELRDLNRHRTGFRHSPLTHDGFYAPPGVAAGHTALLKAQAALYADLVKAGVPAYAYALLLGSQTQFAHSTHLDKLVYELELRTAEGAHFRYADHMRAAAAALFRELPGLEGAVRLGGAAPPGGEI